MHVRIMLFAALLLASACHDDQPVGKSLEAMRIEREVARRVAIAEKDIKARQARLHTIRVVGFVLLAGGAVAGLLWVRQSRFPNIPPIVSRPAQWIDHHPPGEGRVLDLAAGHPPIPSVRGPLSQPPDTTHP